MLKTGRDERLRERRRSRKARAEVQKTPRWQRALGKGDPKITFAVGAVLTLLGASYLAALTNIAKLNYSTVGTVLLVLLVNVIMLALIEVPLISFAIAPDWTPTTIERVKAAFARNGRRLVIIGSTVIGLLVIVRGLITLLS